jgi:hypothetical protein
VGSPGHGETKEVTEDSIEKQVTAWAFISFHATPSLAAGPAGDEMNANIDLSGNRHLVEPQYQAVPPKP